ncbi:MAG: GNAT family N-acetyltransferase [Actinomycetes bacterium]
MAVDPVKRDRVVEAAAEVYSQRSAINAGRRDVARQADLPLRTVSAVGRHRVDLLRVVVEGLPFPPVARHLQEQALYPMEPAMQTLLRASRDVLGDPAAAWDPLELQAMIVAPYDEATREVVAHRLNQRWDAAVEVIHQLRGSAADDAIEDDSAALHVVAVGLGLAILSPISPRWSDGQSWTALVARLLTALAPDNEIDDADPDSLITWRARVAIGSNPSELARLMHALSILRVRVVSLFTAQVNDGQQLVDLILKAPADIDRSTVVQGISSVGTDVIVTRGVVDDSSDVATRVLYLCARLAQNPEAAPKAVADLVLADSWEVTTATVGDDSTAKILRLQWTPERHVVLHRVRAPFTKTERNRASALLALVAALAEVRGEPDSFGWRENLDDGRYVSVRLSRPEDMTGVEEMHERSSAESRYQRYFTPMNEWREDNLRRISGGHRGATLVVTDMHDRIIALGNVFPVGPGETDTAEIAVIVDDAWHGAGVGLLLTRHLVGVARRMGFATLVAYVLADNSAMLGLLARTGLDWVPAPAPDFGGNVTALTASLAD